MTPAGGGVPTPGVPPHDPLPSDPARDLRDHYALLLEEERHRIANGLQLVASMLLRDARLAPEDARGPLLEAHNRVISIAALERHISSPDGQGAGLRPYLVKLCETLSASMIHDGAQVSLSVEVDQSVVDADAMARLGLIVTELVTNAIKHAFPDGRQGAITVSYATGASGWVLTVQDDGVGWPAHTPPGGDAAGSRIVESLARLLHARVSVAPSARGAAVSVTGCRGPSD